MHRQQRLENLNDDNEKKGEIKYEEENGREERKFNLVKKLNSTPNVSNQYQTPMKEKKMDFGGNFNKGKTESTLNFCNYIFFYN